MLQAKVLTFRDPPYADVLFKAPFGSFDAGDRVAYNLTVKNTAGGISPPSAIDLNIDITLRVLDWNSSRLTVHCDTGVVTLNTSLQSVRVAVGTLAAEDKVFCDITSFLVNLVSPNQRISQEAVVEYYGLPSAKRPANYASYMETVRADIFVSPVNAMISTDDNAMNLTSGQQFDYRILLGFPECVTSLQVIVTMPTFLHVPRRRKRELKQSSLGEIGIRLHTG